jgi:hypothetical protein
MTLDLGMPRLAATRRGARYASLAERAPLWVAANLDQVMATDNIHYTRAKGARRSAGGFDGYSG